jgi:capsular polysaccharide transport system permease protein
MNALFAAMWRPAATAAMFLNIILWLSSGTFYLPDMLPQVLRDILWFNPLLHSVELVRAGYYADFHSNILSVQYLFWFPTSVLALALAMEYFFRRRIGVG